MSTWVIISWVLVAVLTVINIVIFLQLKKASEQMLKMAFPNAKNMQDAVSQMQGMMSGLNRGGMGAGGAGGDARLKAAMDMLQKAQKKSGGRPSR